jgi:hypothetical protein
MWMMMKKEAVLIKMLPFLVSTSLGTVVARERDDDDF